MKVMRRTLAPYRRNPPARQQSYGWVIGLGLVALLIWLFTRVSRYNEERVEIERDATGRIKAMTVHRSVH